MQQQTEKPHSKHWWQSIRWRLAFGSMLVVLLTTMLLSIIVVITINVAYSSDQSAQLTALASATATKVGENFVLSKNLLTASEEAVPGLTSTSSTGEQYLELVYGPSLAFVYPRAGTDRQFTAALLLKLADPTGDFAPVRGVVQEARDTGMAQKGQINGSRLGDASRPFVAQPIFAGGRRENSVIGVLLVIPRSSVDNTEPPFLATMRQSIFILALVVSILAAVAAILFSRTITRPLARLTDASRVLAAGNYSARASVSKRGELGEIGELAHSFNEMAERLEQDVEELRRQEQQRRELIMNITHDLATPLTAIAGLGEALVDGIKQNREDFEETGRIIVRETLRLRRLVKDLHMMAKAEAGAMQPQRRAVRLAPLVDEVFAALIPEFERVNVEPCNNLSFNLPPIWADPDMLARVFDNLCSNALRYTPSGGSITVDAKQQGSVLRITVTDTGKGIPTAALPRVFDRFYRADAARQTTTGGSGLGLAIVQAIVESHGGRVFAENAPGGGACIGFTMPLASANWEQMAGEATLPLPLGARPPLTRPPAGPLPPQA
jgi:signal transduction histidine kinase